MVDASGNNLVFLLSTPRAGSTLLSLMLGGHSCIFSPNEQWFLLPLLGVYHDQSATVTPYDQKAASLALRELVGEADFQNAARAFATEIYNAQLRKAAKPIFLDKTPRYYYILPTLDQLFPSAKKIWLKRNPLDVAASFVLTWNMPLPELIGERITPSTFDLTLGLLKYVQYFKGQPGTFELSYEDLVVRSEKHLHQMCDFIGVELESNLETYSLKHEHVNSLRNTSMGDKKVFEHARPHAGSIGQWKKVLNRDEVQLYLNFIGCRPFERMGYGDTLKDLKQSGYTFPSEAEVEERLQSLEGRARAFPFGSPEQLAAVEGTQQLVRRLRRHWWVKLGGRLGLCRLSSI